MTGQQGQGEAERGDLGERQVDEDHAAGEHVQAEIGVDPREDQAGQERQGQQVEHAALSAPRPGRRPVGAR
jgi:hypothetical protein